MTSKASKLKAHRIRQRQYAGRPKKEGVERYSNGEIKHFEREKEVRAVVMEARDRVHGNAIDNASQYAGYVLGRMFLDGRISALEREAGDEYASMMVRYYALTGIPFPSARAQCLFSIKGHEGDISEDRANRARHASNRMMELEGYLLRLSDGPRIKTTVYNTCVQDFDIMRTMSDLQLSWLKKGLQEIHYQLGLSKARSAV